MSNIIEFGKRGAEHLDAEHLNVEQTPDVAPLPVHEADQLKGVIRQFNSFDLEVEVNDGTKRDIEVRGLDISDPRVFGLVHALGQYSPMVYAYQAPRNYGQYGRSVMGMLSPSYDTHGEHRLDEIKVLPLERPLPLLDTTGSGKVLVPDAGMASMLTGLVTAEGQGVGGHHGKISEDFEHRLTLLGAVSLGDASTMTGHANHRVRRESSVATGLANGQLGTVFTGGVGADDFTGFGQPLVFRPDSVQHGDAIYFPDSFLESEEAYAANYREAPRYALGYAMGALQGHDEPWAVKDRINGFVTELDQAPVSHDH